MRILDRILRDLGSYEEEELEQLTKPAKCASIALLFRVSIMTRTSAPPREGLDAETRIVFECVDAAILPAVPEFRRSRSDVVLLCEQGECSNDG